MNLNLVGVWYHIKDLSNVSAHSNKKNIVLWSFGTSFEIFNLKRGGPSVTMAWLQTILEVLRRPLINSIAMDINITPKQWKSPDLLRRFLENRLNVANGRFRVVVNVSVTYFFYLYERRSKCNKQSRIVSWHDFTRKKAFLGRLKKLRLFLFDNCALAWNWAFICPLEKIRHRAVMIWHVISFLVVSFWAETRWNNTWSKLEQRKFISL